MRIAEILQADANIRRRVIPLILCLASLLDEELATLEKDIVEVSERQKQGTMAIDSWTSKLEVQRVSCSTIVDRGCSRSDAAVVLRDCERALAKAIADKRELDEAGANLKRAHIQAKVLRDVEFQVGRAVVAGDLEAVRALQVRIEQISAPADFT